MTILPANIFSIFSIQVCITNKLYLFIHSVVTIFFFFSFEIYRLSFLEFTYLKQWHERRRDIPSYVLRRIYPITQENCSQPIWIERKEEKNTQISNKKNDCCQLFDQKWFARKVNSSFFARNVFPRGCETSRLCRQLERVSLLNAHVWKVIWAKTVLHTNTCMLYGNIVIVHITMIYENYLFGGYPLTATYNMLFFIFCFSLLHCI